MSMADKKKSVQPLVGLNLKSVLGAVVVHKSGDLGRGIVVACDKDYISIRFDLDAPYCKPHKFPFPDIFIDKRQLISTDDDMLKSVIRSTQSKYICEGCGSYSSSLILLNGKKLCMPCKNRLVQCASCGDFFDKDMCICRNKTYQCKSCFNKTHSVCNICGDVVDNDSVIVSPYISDGKPICESCAEWNYIQCSCCWTWMPEDSGVTIKDHRYDITVCPECAKNYVTKCAVCGCEFIDESKEKLLYNDCETREGYKEYIESLNFQDLCIESFSFHRFKNMRTLNLMSRLRHYYDSVIYPPPTEDEKSFDILLLYTYFGKLVIVWDLPQKFASLSEHRCTLTALKRDGYFHLFDNSTCEKMMTKDIGNNKIFHVWKAPYHLKAQTYADMNYGDRWKGRYMVYEGNKYGDTSDFYILGYITDND